MLRGATSLSGLKDIRTMTSSKKRSISRVQSSTYLDLYMLSKEKDRLEKEGYILEKRKKVIQKKLDEINTEMGRLKKEDANRRKAYPEEFKKPLKKDWKTMPLKY